jgi:Transposase DDE domain group 1
MGNPTGEAKSEALRLDFDRRLMLQFRGSVITSNGGLLAYREMDDVLALTASGGGRLAEPRTGQNRRHLLVGLLRQSVFGRLAGYEDVDDAGRLCRDPAMRWVVGGRAPMGRAASASQMGRFETEWLARPENLAALADLPGQWIDTVHQRRQPRVIVLDMDSSESPTYGDQEGRKAAPTTGILAAPATIRCCRSAGHPRQGVRRDRRLCRGLRRPRRFSAQPRAGVHLHDVIAARARRRGARRDTPPETEPGRTRARSGARRHTEAPLGRGRAAGDAVA